MILVTLDYATKDGASAIYEQDLPPAEQVALLVARRHLFNEFKLECWFAAEKLWKYGVLVNDNPEGIERAFEDGA